MENDVQNVLADQEPRESWLGLKGLRLTTEELKALKRQGFVTCEVRGPRSTVYKLRFRVQGKQRVRYLGTDAALAETVRKELAEIQHFRRLDAQLRELTCAARQVLRASKPRLAKLVLDMGFTFHGTDVRRPRQERHA